MTTFSLLATDGIFGGGAVSPLAQTASLSVQLYHPNGSGWARGLVRARLNRDCRLFSDIAQTTPLQAISSYEETILQLDDTGTGNLLVFQQALLKPLDGTAKTSLAPAATPQSDVAYNPYYIITLPDATMYRLVPPSGAVPGQISGALDTYIWTPSIVVPF